MVKRVSAKNHTHENLWYKNITNFPDYRYEEGIRFLAAIYWPLAAGQKQEARDLKFKLKPCFENYPQNAIVKLPAACRGELHSF
jgi:hypothetical protein